jgi:hypothetical protein
VIFLTVNATVHERARQLGARSLTKPVMADDVLRTVRSVLAQAAS